MSGDGLGKFWRQFEPQDDKAANKRKAITELNDVLWFLKLCKNRLPKHADKDTKPEQSFVFLWRGHSDEHWGLFTSLYRARFLSNTKARATLPTRDIAEDIAEAEDEILSDLLVSGLGNPQGTYLPRLVQLALLRHYGGPARLLDVTRNPFIALFFACQEPPGPATDGRLFLIAIPKQNVVNHLDSSLQTYVDSLKTGVQHPSDSHEQSTRSGISDSTTDLLYLLRQRPKNRTTDNKYVGFWSPPSSIDPRHAAQQGGFLLAPLANGINFGKNVELPHSNDSTTGFTAEQHQMFTDLALRPHFATSGPGRPTQLGVFTIRVNKSKKEDLRNALRSDLGISEFALFPDYAGFAQYANSRLSSRG